MALCFEEATVQVETEAGEADATVRGSPSAVVGALFGTDGGTVAVLGDETVFHDFRDSFRPHLKLPPTAERFVEEAGDAVRIGAKAVRSAFEGVAAATRDHLATWPDWLQRAHPDTGELRGEVDELKERVAQLEQRLSALESAASQPPADEAPAQT